MLSWIQTNRLLVAAIGMAMLASIGAMAFLLLLRIPDHPYQLGAAIGLFIEAILETGSYEVVRDDRSWVASKMPVLPLLYAALWQITGSITAMTILKNVIFVGLLLMFLLRYGRVMGADRRVLALSVAVMFCIPVNAFVMMGLSYEEAILFALVPIAIGLTIIARRPADMWILALLVAAMYLTKSSVLVFCAWLAVLALLNLPKADLGISRAAPAVALLAAMLAWGGFTYVQTGHFAFGSGASSNNGMNLFKGNNPQVADIYPWGHLDILNPELRDGAPDFTDEWEENAWFADRATAYMRENPDEVLQNGLLKLRVLFIHVADFDFNRNRLVKILVHDVGMVVNRIVQWVALIAAAAWLLRRGDGQGWRDPRRYAGLVFLGAFAAYALPYLVGFLYIRHVVPLFISAFLIVMLLPWPFRARTGLPQSNAAQ
ncbi:hypothetical protein V8J82_23365 [Gymnodinialimonas sp. 2305UL16-5]|uniref:hypothetical protein n=1 Tax=Gymnodinialimonas mytili TaxID=3126503 RepID=UPI0030B10EFF